MSTVLTWCKEMKLEKWAKSSCNKLQTLYCNILRCKFRNVISMVPLEALLFYKNSILQENSHIYHRTQLNNSKIKHL
jgi:hypothetical protein